MPKSFLIDGLSFRPKRCSFGIGYNVSPRGQRSFWSRVAEIRPASDGTTFLVNPSGGIPDARSSLDEAIELALEIEARRAV